MARTKPTVAEAAAAARREFDAALAAAAAETRRKALMANVRGKMATAAGRREAFALLAASAPARNDGGSISSLSEAPPRPPSGSPPAAAPPSPDQYSPASGEILCRYGARCYRPDCKFKHPTAYVAQAPACRDGWHCTRKDCGFTHPPGVHDTVRLPFELRHVLLDGGGRVIQEIRRRVRDARIHIANGQTVACLVDVKAASASALEHAREYLAWTEHIAVSRGFQLDKTRGFGQVVTQRYQGALTREKRRRVGRKLTKGEKNECKREADAYKPPAQPRFFDPLEWDRFVAPPGARAPTRGPASGVERAQRRRKMAQKRAAASASRKRRRDYDETSYDSFDNICGFSPGDAEELMCQGVKPWDDDAGDVLAALYY